MNALRKEVGALVLFTLAAGAFWFGCYQRKENNEVRHIRLEQSDCSLSTSQYLSKDLMKQLNRQVDLFEKMLNDEGTGSQIAKINIAAGRHPVEVDKPVVEIVQKSLNFARLSHGRYDPSAAPLYLLWQNARAKGKEPSRSEIHSQIENVNYRRISVNPGLDRVFIPDKGMLITTHPGLDGYIVDELIGRLHQHDITDICVSKGIVKSTINGDTDFTFNEIILNEKPSPESSEVVKLKGIKTRAHASLYTEEELLINLTTGYPVKNGIVCVAVFGPEAYAAEVLSHIVATGEINNGIALVEELPFFEVVCFTEEHEVFCTSGIQHYINEVNPEYTVKIY